MSLKRFAMLAAISYQNQQGYNNNNNNNSNNKSDNITNNDTQTTFLITTTTEATTKIINSNKSTLIQLKQQQQSQQINATTFLGTTTTTTTTTSKSPLIPLFSNKTSSTSNQLKHDHHNDGVGSDNRNRDIIDYSSSSYSSESSESLDSGQQITSDRHPANTYTSTTYYGSGFGVFHQQNMRSNGGGGIALITGSSSSNGLGGGSYSNGINNNVNLLLGGAMLTLITTILCVVCYCCHRNIKKRTEAAYRQQHQWLENDPNMEIYSVEQCYETSGLFVGDSMDGLATIPALHHEPPPSYDAVVAMQEQQQLLMQQHQQQLLMQQQLLQQQLATNNSPPPGYRSSLDVSRGSGLGGVLTVGGSIISGMEINSLASSTANLGTASSISPIDPLLNYNDVNGNVASSAVPVASVTPTNTRTTASYMRSKQQHLQQQQQQRQRNAPTNQLSQLNMKKVLQAQSCCSLQRAEVENMWNAAAAALAARTAHLPSDSRASTTASTSSPTLATNARKQSQGPETFGTRYLKQNYYRRGCPLCGKFRYDHDSTLSMSLESNLDTLAGALAEENVAAEQDTDQQTTQSNLNNHETNTSDYKAKSYEEADGHDDNEVDEEDDELDDNENEIEQQCSCLNSKQKRELSINTQNAYERINTQNKIPETEELRRPNETNESESSTDSATDANANCEFAAERQSRNPAPSNNNNEITNTEDSLNLPSTSATTASPKSCCSSVITAAATSSATSTPPVTINLDCINENGIISLDMSKIIDKTGLPTYDAALKLESSGYV